MRGYSSQALAACLCDARGTPSTGQHAETELDDAQCFAKKHIRYSNCQNRQNQTANDIVTLSNCQSVSHSHVLNICVKPFKVLEARPLALLLLMFAGGRRLRQLTGHGTGTADVRADNKRLQCASAQSAPCWSDDWWYTD